MDPFNISDSKRQRTQPQSHKWSFTPHHFTMGISNEQFINFISEKDGSQLRSGGIIFWGFRQISDGGGGGGGSRDRDRHIQDG